jgi:hypothetical protein
MGKNVSLKNPPLGYMRQQCLRLLQTWDMRLLALEQMRPQLSREMLIAMEAALPSWLMDNIEAILELRRKHLRYDEIDPIDWQMTANGWAHARLEGVDNEEDLRALWNQIKNPNFSLEWIEDNIWADAIRRQKDKLIRKLFPKEPKKPSAKPKAAKAGRAEKNGSGKNKA